MADLYYYETGYIDQNYFGYVADAVIEISPYIVEGYLEDGYYTDYSSLSSLVCDAEILTGVTVEASGTWSSAASVSATVTRIQYGQGSLASAVTASATAGRIQQAQAAFTSAFTPTLTAIGFKNYVAVLDATASMTVSSEVNRSANVLLEHIADLNAMAAKTAVSNSSMASTITISSSAVKSTVSSAALTSTATVSALVDNVTFFDASIVCYSSLVTSRWLGTGRPRTGTVDASAYYDATTKYEGTHSIARSSTGSIYTSDQADQFRPTANQAFYFSTYAWVDEGPGPDTAANRRILAGVGQFTNQLTNNRSTTQDMWYVAMLARQLSVSWNIGGTFYTGSTNSGTIDLNGTAGWVFIEFYRQANSTTVYYSASGTPVAGSSAQRSFTAASQNGALVQPDAANRKLKLFGVDNAYFSGADPITRFDYTTYSVNGIDQIILPFNNSSDDYTQITQEGAATLSSAVTLTAQANNNVKGAAAAISCFVSLSSVGSKTILANVALSSAGSLTATVGLVKDIASDQNSSTTVTAQAYRVKQFDINAGALFTPSVSVNVRVNPFATLDSTASITITAIKTARITETISAVVSQSTTVKKYAGITKTLSAAASVTAISGFRKSADSAVTAQASLTATAIKPTLATATFNAYFNCTPFISRTWGTGRPRFLISNGGELADISKVGANSVVIDQQGEYIRIPADQGLDQFGVFEFWFAINKDPANIDSYSGGPSAATNAGWTAPLLTYGKDDNYIFRLQVYRDNDTASLSNYHIYYDDSTAAADQGIVNTNPLELNSDGSATWFKIRVTRTADNDLTVKLYNSSLSEIGSRSGNYGANIPSWEQGITFWSLRVNNRIWNGSQYVISYVRTRPLWIDEVLLTNINGVTNSLETQPWLFSDQTDVLALYHFDGQAPYEWPGGVGTFYNQDDYSIRQTFTANMAVSATQSTTALKVVAASAGITAQFSVNCQAVVRRSAVMSVTAISTQTTTAARSRSTAVALSATMVQITEPKKYVGFFSVENVITATQSTAGARIRFGIPQLSAIATELTAAAKNATGTISMASVATVSVTVRKITDRPQLLSAAFDLSVTAAKIVFAQGSSSAAATLSAEITRIQPVTANCTAQSTVTAQATKRTGIISQMSASLSQSVTVLRIRKSPVALNVVAAISTNNQILRLAQAQLNSQFTTLFTVTKLIKASATLSAQGFVLTVGDVINIDPYYQITIAPESRSMFILAESRIITIESETRVNII